MCPLKLQKLSAVTVLDNAEHVPIATIVDECCEDTSSATGLPDESVFEDPLNHDMSGSTCQTADTDRGCSRVLDLVFLDTTKVVHILTNT